MSLRVRSGLIAGAGGFLLTLCIGVAVGLCGPLGGIAAGAVAGLLTIRGQAALPRNQAARDGAVSGAIAGVLCLFGQLIGTLGSLSLVPAILARNGGQLPFGQLPTSGDTVGQAAYWVSGLGTGVCFGLIGLALAAGAGAAVAYMMSPQQPPAPQPPAV